MSKMPLNELLVEMQGKSFTYGWDALTLYDQRKANELLHQLYIERFNTEDGYIKPMSIEIRFGDGDYKDHIFDLKLSAPRLSFENSAPDLGAQTRLTMDMIGGMIVTTKKENNVTYVSKMLQVLPLGGPQLTMEVPVTKGGVGGLGKVLIDLKNATNFKANFVIGPIDQATAGKYFEEYFKVNLSPEMKIFELGELKGDLTGNLVPNNFEIRTRKSSVTAVFGDLEYGDGAIMMFITLKGGTDGTNYSTNSSLYPIPTDGGAVKYTGAMLLSSRVLFDRIMRGPAVEEIGNGVSFLGYSGGYDLAFALEGASGGIPLEFRGHYQQRASGVVKKDIYISMDLEFGFKQDAGGKPLTIKSAGDCIEFWLRKDYKPYIRERVDSHEIIGEDTDKTLPADLQCNYSERFDVRLDKGTGVVSFQSNNAPEFSFYLSPPDLEWVVINQGTIQQVITKEIQPKLENLLPRLTTPTIDTFLLRNLLFPNHNALQLTDAFVPGDLAVFGQIDPLRTTTVLAPLNKTIGAGETLQFCLTPMPDNVEWAAVDVDGHMLLPDAISTCGLFTAPSKLTDGFVAVMVTAKGTLNNLPVQSSALVTVLQSATVTNPMYNSCDIGKSLELSAQSLGDTPLVWDIKTKQWGSSLGAEDPAKPGFRQYTAGTNMDPDVPFPIDIIEVKNTADDTVSYIYIMLKKTLVVVPLALHESSDPVKGTIKFQMLGNNGQPIVPTPGVTTVTWELLHGNGELDEETGIYTEPNTVVPGSFVVISAVADFSGVMQLHGRTAIPLPLRKYAELIGAVNNTVLNS
jgi:hypothetical protein